MKWGNLTSAAEMRSPGAEGTPFSGECYFEIVCYMASPPEHLVLVGDWGYWDRCTAGLIWPGETFYFCMRFVEVKVIVNGLLVLLRAPTSPNLLLRWLKICYELPRLELVKRNSQHPSVHTSFYCYFILPEHKKDDSVLLTEKAAWWVSGYVCE